MNKGSNESSLKIFATLRRIDAHGYFGSDDSDSSIIFARRAFLLSLLYYYNNYNNGKTHNK